MKAYYINYREGFRKTTKVFRELMDVFEMASRNNIWKSSGDSGILKLRRQIWANKIIKDLFFFFHLTYLYLRFIHFTNILIIGILV